MTTRDHQYWIIPRTDGPGFERLCDWCRKPTGVYIEDVTGLEPLCCGPCGVVAVSRGARRTP